MENPRAEKVAVVTEVRERLSQADAAILTEYRGLKVKELATLRRALREVGGDYKIYKNSLVRFAARDLGLLELDELLVGPTAVAFVDGDAVGVAKALRDYGRTHPLLVIKGGVLGTKFLNADDTSALADLPPREVLLARLAGAFAAPMVQFAGLLGAIPRNFAYGLSALLEKLGGAPDADAAAADAGPADAGPADAGSADGTAVADGAVADGAVADAAQAVADGAVADAAPAEAAGAEAAGAEAAGMPVFGEASAEAASPVTDEPISVETAAAPVEAETPTPVEAETLAPDGTSAAPAAAETAPVEAETSAPVETETSAPVEAETSAPVEAETSAPVEATMVPVDADTPVPVETAAAPVEAGSPLPADDVPVEAAPDADEAAVADTADAESRSVESEAATARDPDATSGEAADENISHLSAEQPQE